MMLRTANYNSYVNPTLLGLEVNIGKFFKKKRASKIICKHVIVDNSQIE
jgi:hypothetical protein